MSVIAISRGTRSGGLELAGLLSERLGYTTLSREQLIADSAKKFSIMEEFLEVRLDKTPSLWQRFTNEYGRYICFMQCALLQAVKHDNVIYHGHAGQFFLRGLPGVLKLRIEAPLEYRVRPVMADFDYSHDQAVEYIERVDDERRRWVKMVYNQDWCDPSLYDMCVNLQNMSMDTVCDVVAMVLEHDDFKTSQETLRRLGNADLQCNVQAALFSDDKIWNNQQVTVSARNGVISLRGTARSSELRDLIIDTASRVSGVVECRSEIKLPSDALR